MMIENSIKLKLKSIVMKTRGIENSIKLFPVYEKIKYILKIYKEKNFEILLIEEDELNELIEELRKIKKAINKDIQNNWRN